jgi:hypothetical protein
MMTQSSTAMRWCNASFRRGLKPALVAGFLLLGLSIAGQTSPLRVPIPEPKPKPAISTPQKPPSGSAQATPVPMSKPEELKDLPHGIVSLAVIPNEEYAARLQDLAASSSSVPSTSSRRAARLTGR